MTPLEGSTFGPYGHLYTDQTSAFTSAQFSPRDGRLYITDSKGAQEPYWKPQGRLVRIEGSGSATTVLAENSPAPNGIAFTPGFDGLWVARNTANRIDFFRLSEGGKRS